MFVEIQKILYDEFLESGQTVQRYSEESFFYDRIHKMVEK